MFKDVLMDNKGALIRIIVFVLAWLNQYLTSKGYQPLPVLGEAEVAVVVTFIASVLTLINDNKVTSKTKELKE
ncbi:holin [Bacillus cereus]|uniref:phage holin n=2 Tax=Bacillaceae TaxID=186817 RepID=UPI000474246D|nr:holin [Bacillus cereus]MRD36247.1 holin [Bacillus thuringiensis]MBY0014941.1 holin [Bacillus cereus]MBY0133106.1 holin [Bacillus cereus]MDA1963927.1 phage holin [Bacillus cereus]